MCVNSRTPHHAAQPGGGPAPTGDTSAVDGACCLAIDLGTARLKVVAVDPGGRAIAAVTSGYPTHRAAPLAAEQDPDDWWKAAVEAVQALLAGPELRARRPIAIGLTGQMHGVILIDGLGRVIRPCLTHEDQRGSIALPWLASKVEPERCIEITGNPLNAGFSAPKLAWLREQEPDAWASTSKVLLPKDFLRWRLTGDLATDVTDASGTLLFDLGGRAWSDEIAEAWQFDVERLPKVRESGEIAGVLTGSAAEVLGLPPGIPVVTGSGDAPAAAFAQGVGAATGVAMLSLGTAGQIVLATARPIVDARGRVHALCYVQRQSWCLMAAILDAGGALAWFADLVGARDDEIDTLLALASQVPAGSDGVIFRPQLSGERTPRMDSQASASLHGLRRSQGRATVARAVLEGVAYSFREGLDVLRELGQAPSMLRLTGGGSRSSVWAEILAAVLCLPLEVASNPHASAIGAAMLAGAAMGLPMTEDRPAAEAARCVIEPSHAEMALYSDTYRSYLALGRSTRASDPGPRDHAAAPSQSLPKTDRPGTRQGGDHGG